MDEKLIIKKMQEDINENKKMERKRHYFAYP